MALSRITNPFLNVSGAVNANIASPSANTIAFTTAATERMRIDSAGNLGIGATSFAYTAKLNLSGSQYITGGSIENWAGAYNLYNTTTNYSGIQFYKGTSAISGSTRQAVVECQYDTLFNIKTDAAIPIIFVTNSGEAARISSSQNFSIGASDSGSAWATSKLYVNGGYAQFKHTDNPILVWNPTTAGTRGLIQFATTVGSTRTDVGNINTNGTTTTYGTSSDYRLKENIVPMTGALAKIAALKPVTYKWKIDGSEGQGFIAHELQEVVPDCVTGEKDAVDADGNPVHQSIDSSFLIATLTAAIQELKVIVDAQTVEIAALKANQLPQ
jgi:hypothetical protein